jgi:hypothetical protein
VKERFQYEFANNENTVVFRVHVQTDADGWIIKDAEEFLIIKRPGETVQAAEFLVRSSVVGRARLYITVSRQDTGAEIQHIWMDVMAAPAQQGRFRSWLSSLLPQRPAPPIANDQRVATDKVRDIPQTSVQAPSPQGKPMLHGNVQHIVQDTDLIATGATLDAMMMTAVPSSSASGVRGTPALPPPSPMPQRVMLPLNSHDLSSKTVRITFQQGSHSSGYSMFVSAHLPDKHIERSFQLPLNIQDIQAMTIRLREGLAQVVNYQPSPGDYAFSNTESIHIEETEARNAAVNLAEAGRLVWSRLFGSPNASAELRGFGESIRNLPVGSTIQIVLDNPDIVIPWALLYDKPGSPTAATIDWSGFWGYRYQIDVLIPGEYPVPAITKQARRGYDFHLLLNDDPTLHPYTEVQKVYIGQHLGEAKYRVDHGEDAVQALKRRWDAALMHCYCHGRHQSGQVRAGAFPEESLLNFGGSSVQLIDLTEEAEREDYQSVVLLNACESATQQPFFYGGFMPYFIQQRGARAFIGTETLTPQLFAHDFALEFWKLFAAGQSVGAILWQLRRHYLEQHNNILGFLYSLYGLGDARLAEPIIEP